MADVAESSAAVAEWPGDPGSAVDSPAGQRGFYGRLDADSDATCVSMFGELDVAAAKTAERLLRRAELSDLTAVVVDLSGLDFIDSTGLRLIIVASSRLGDRLTLLRAPAAVHRTFERTDTVRLLPFAD